MLSTPRRVLSSTKINIPVSPPQSEQYNKYGWQVPSLSDGMSDQETPSPVTSPAGAIRCFCGRTVDSAEGGIYCSVACARSDAFSSLCYKPSNHSHTTLTFPQPVPTPHIVSGASSSAPLSRGHSAASMDSASTSTSADVSDSWDASHYRRLARADIRKEERKEERRKRRADMTSRSTASSISSMPELVGGHSRNVSVASTVSSAYTVGSLSRNPSSASTASSRRFGGGINVDEPIMEDEDESEWLQETSRQIQPYTAAPYVAQHKKHHRRRESASGLSSGKLRQLEAFGMGKDMRDVLEEIIQMEKEFVLSDSEHETDDAPNQGIYTATFNRPPRTPSPVPVDRRQTRLPIAPGAPVRGHRMSMSNLQRPQIERLSAALGSSTTATPRLRPQSSMMGHQSSLSESHTALYLATASPAGAGPRSISPRLQDRKSLTFTPEHAGPSIGALRLPRFDSPAGVTPVRRRGNISPSAHHPAMDGWKFPGANATPTRPPPINTTNLPGNFSTPVGPRHGSGQNDTAQTQQGSEDRITPQLLWPATALPPPLAPALFPCSPATNTPEFLRRHASHAALPPHSGLRLGVLLGSGDDVEMEDGESTLHGHGHDAYGGMEDGTTGYLPVYLGSERYGWN